jgi:hypothetical protein
MRVTENTSVVANEDFVTLIQVAQQDPIIREQLVAILSLDKFNRTSALNTFVEQLQFQKAPKKFTEAIASFLNDSVAEKALSVLKQS